MAENNPNVVILKLTKRQMVELGPLFDRALTEAANGNNKGGLFGVMFQPFTYGEMQAAYMTPSIAKGIQRILRRHGLTHDPRVREDRVVFVEAQPVTD